MTYGRTASAARNALVQADEIAKIKETSEQKTKQNRE
jgi:hypothetical protein